MPSTTHTLRRPRHDRLERLRAFLEVLTCGADRGELLEVREHDDQRGWRQHFHPLDRLDRTAHAIHAAGARRDVYVGALPRAHARGTRDAIASAGTVWVDADTPAAIARLAAFRPAPAIVVGSGRGRHAYWPLQQPIDVAAGELANQRLAAHLAADPGSCDAARILRPPGTRNFKYRPAAAVTLLTLTRDRRIAIDDLQAALPAAKSSESEQVARRDRGRDAGEDWLLDLQPATYVRALLGSSPGRDGKITCPFHSDTHPSLHVYPTAAQGWWCFSCRRGGSIYDLAGDLWDLQTRGVEFLKLRDRLQHQLGVSQPPNGGRNA